jgi:hypothetical protein
MSRGGEYLSLQGVQGQSQGLIGGPSLSTQGQEMSCSRDKKALTEDDEEDEDEEEDEDNKDEEDDKDDEDNDEDDDEDDDGEVGEEREETTI